MRSQQLSIYIYIVGLLATYDMAFLDLAPFFQRSDQRGPAYLQGAVEYRRVVTRRRRKAGLEVDDRIDKEREGPTAFRSWRCERIVDKYVSLHEYDGSFLVLCDAPSPAGDRFVRWGRVGFARRQFEHDGMGVGADVALAA